MLVGSAYTPSRFHLILLDLGITFAQFVFIVVAFGESSTTPRRSEDPSTPGGVGLSNGGYSTLLGDEPDDWSDSEDEEPIRDTRQFPCFPL